MIMGMDDSGIIKTCIDASYAVHPDMRGQLGGMISLENNSVTQKSLKKKLNAKS